MKQVMMMVLVAMVGGAFQSWAATEQSVKPPAVVPGEQKVVKKAVNHGAALLTFDDSRLDEWVKAIPLFKKYNAHATFFFNYKVDEKAVAAARALIAAGHTVGVHALHHLDAPVDGTDAEIEKYWYDEVKPQIDGFAAAGIKITAMAYPNNRRSDATDRVLAAKGIKHFRAGQRNVRQYKSSVPVDWIKLEDAYMTPTEAAEAQVFKSIGCGTIYATRVEDMMNALHRVAERNEVFSIYSHGIFPGATGIHMPTEWLEAMLAEGARLGVEFIGMDELL